MIAKYIFSMRRDIHDTYRTIFELLRIMDQNLLPNFKNKS